MPQSTPGSLFSAHLAEVAQRSAAALERSGFEALILHAGEPLELFRDDQHYPFKAHPPFKWWAPLLDAPGSLVLFQPGRRPTLILRIRGNMPGWWEARRWGCSWWPRARGNSRRCSIRAGCLERPGAPAFL